MDVVSRDGETLDMLELLTHLLLIGGTPASPGRWTSWTRPATHGTVRSERTIGGHIVTDGDIAADVHAGDDEPSPFEMAVRWARHPAPGLVRRDALPAAVSGALDEAIIDRTGSHAVVLAARSVIDGVETARMGPERPLPPDDELVVVSVVTSEVDTVAIHVIAHTVVAHVVAD